MWCHFPYYFIFASSKICISRPDIDNYIRMHEQNFKNGIKRKKTNEKKKNVYRLRSSYGINERFNHNNNKNVKRFVCVCVCVCHQMNWTVTMNRQWCKANFKGINYTRCRKQNEQKKRKKTRIETTQTQHKINDWDESIDFSFSHHGRGGKKRSIQANK